MLVGRDTQLHELMILFGTLGGLVFFGVAGVIIGPIIAALFVTVWDIYGAAFKEVLPEVAETETAAAHEIEQDPPPETH
ncbi:MAG: AI-2E family transporter, partial [Desulfatitalea sp.]|nr:AI-2E family transporter [Desulfatitalea sp.]NNK00788.1 AI-2E family transporter [Desulfatitalea sp.]